MPKSLSGQFVLLLVVSLVCAQVLNVYLLMGERQYIARSGHYEAVIDRLVTEARKLPDLENARLPLVIVEDDSEPGAIFVSEVNRADRESRGRALPQYAQLLQSRLDDAGINVIQTSSRTLSFSERPPPPREGAGGPRGPRPPPGGPPRRGPPPGGEPRMYHPSAPPAPGGRPGPGFEEVVFSAEISPGIWLNALSPHYATEALTSRAIWTTGLTLLGSIIAAILLARQIGKPIRKLSDAAEALGRGELIEPLPEQGPKDIEAATRAFNTMQERLTRLIEEQRATLRAVGHDLRTPLTSLRIRAEAVPEEFGREKLIDGLELLAAMTEEILSWSKDASAMEEVVSVDLGALLDSLAQDYIDQSKSVAFEAPTGTLVIKCRRMGVRRAVRNIIDNALIYGGHADLSVRKEDEHYCIEVIDDGPGIPEEALEEVLIPFRRLEQSRNRETGGTGLGLSIAQSIMSAHGGEIKLANESGRGLRVLLCLPPP
ncbi:MAG: ATP-binding protein [Pseudomonadota bacterium]